MFKNIYSVARLVMLTVIITYFLGCLFYFLSFLQNSEGFKDAVDCQCADNSLEVCIEKGLNCRTFISVNSLDQDKFDRIQRLITCCYFAITTLATVGYGDIYPISNFETIIGIFVMLGGVGFFSFIMGSFIEIISNFNGNLSSEDQTFELHNWITLLTRFRENKPLPNSLYNQINNHFKYYWANNRLA